MSISPTRVAPARPCSASPSSGRRGRPRRRTRATASVARSARARGCRSGFVSDGVTRLDLTSALTATLTALTAQTTVDVAAQGVHISETASVSGTASVAVTTDFSLTSGGETVRSNGTVMADTATRTVGGNIAVTVNGQAFATITVGPTGPSYAGASGVQLTAADQTALRSLFTASINLFLTVFLLTEPALVLNL